MCWQVSLPISNERIGFISTETIALAIYLKSWALITSIIASKFLLNKCSFFLEVIGVGSLGSLTF